MFRKIVSNLAFSPALVGQLGFYAKRLRKEEATRRIGLIFTVLALIIQGFAVLTPPESANAANGDDIIYGGFTTKNALLSIYDRNKDSAGHGDIQQIYSAFGISRQDIANGQISSINSHDFNSSIQSIGRSTYSWQRDPHAIPGTSTTVYSSLLAKFDSTSWTIPHGSTYSALVGKRSVDGQWFAIMMGCGNAAYINLPPPPPQPVALCSGLTIAPITRTKYTFSASSSVTNGASISGYTYVIKNSSGGVIYTKSQPSTTTSDSLTYEFANEGQYTATVNVSTSLGSVTSANCQKPLTVSPEARCTLNTALVQSSPDCKPCENNQHIWYKDKDCHATFVLSKTVTNVSQVISDANNTTAHAGDRLEYHLTVKNVGTTTGSYTMEDSLADVLEYANMVDTGGGTLAPNDGTTPVEKVNTITWPSIDIKPGASIEKIVNVQVKAAIPATPQGLSNPESYDCRMVNDFAGNHTIVAVDCATPKVVEQVVSELPHTGATENLLFTGGVFAIVVYFYARSRQVKKEVRLIRRDLNAGTI